MKKRWIIPLIIVLAITTMLLITGIFKLYTEAEKVQRSIFTNEALVAGENIVNRIDVVLKGDTIPMHATDTLSSADTTKIIYQKYAKRFILDSANTPTGLIRTTISYAKNNIINTINDTTYFDTNYRKIFPTLPFWAIEVKEELDKIKPKIKTNANLIEMDSNTIQLLNRDFLNRIISEALIEQTIIANFDFALYNALTTKFVLEPTTVSAETMLASEYVFNLKTSDKFIAPHYLILHFENERGIYFQRMSTLMFFIAAFLAIIIFITLMTLFLLYRQKRNIEIRTDFIKNITHEFKTPISTISLACEGLEDPNLQDETALKEIYISIIKEENNRLKTMVSNILQLAQLNKGQLKMKMESCDMHELIKKVTDAVSLQISAANGNLSLQLNAENTLILGDMAHLENIIINMVENAIKYSNDKPVIEIKTYNIKKYFALSIKDYGTGIAKKNQKRIFQEFYRVSSGNIHNTKGHGLGLGYVKKVVVLHAGHIEVKSELNKGTNFIVFLPTK
jgi:two-component system phosphate regulon sensor histidine kinase PhoR